MFKICEYVKHCFIKYFDLKHIFIQKSRDAYKITPSPLQPYFESSRILEMYPAGLLQIIGI